MGAAERICCSLSGTGWRKDLGFQQDSSGHVGRQGQKRGRERRGGGERGREEATLAVLVRSFSQDVKTHVCHSQGN